MEHQFHFGKKFYQDKKKGYWISTTYPRIRAHVWVWISKYGKIPTNYHIHHINENKSDNRIENLELIHKKRHMSHHMSTEERKEFSRKHAEKIRPLTKFWHASIEGRKWHKNHAERFNFGKWDPVEHKCEQCSKEYKTIKKSSNRFCSNACKSKWRRLNKLDDIEKTCPICLQSYKSNKYSRSKTCGRKCGKNLLKSKIN